MDSSNYTAAEAGVQAPNNNRSQLAGSAGNQQSASPATSHPSNASVSPNSLSAALPRQSPNPHSYDSQSAMARLPAQHRASPLQQQQRRFSPRSQQAQMQSTQAQQAQQAQSQPSQQAQQAQQAHSTAQLASQLLGKSPQVQLAPQHSHLAQQQPQQQQQQQQQQQPQQQQNTQLSHLSQQPHQTYQPSSVNPSTILGSAGQDSSSSLVSTTPPKRTGSPFRDSSNADLKQINSQRRPLYTPAVLRSTTNLALFDPSKPDGGLGAVSHSSVSSSVGAPGNGSVSPLDYRQSSLPSIASNQRPRMVSSSSASSVASTSSISSYWNYLRGSDGTVPAEEWGPTRRHWKPNSSRFSCFRCKRVFNYMTPARRKHHCRACGELFCGDCLRNYIYLDKDARFAIFGAEDDGINGPSEKYLSKVCIDCAAKYEQFVKDHTSADHNLGGSEDYNKNKANGRRGSAFVGAIPADWDWSSF